MNKNTNIKQILKQFLVKTSLIFAGVGLALLLTIICVFYFLESKNIQEFEKNNAALDTVFITEEVNRMTDYLNGKVMIASLIVIVVILIVTFIVRRKVNQISFQVSEPIKKLSERTKYIGLDVSNEEVKATGIEEIDTLNNNFSKMSAEIKKRTEKLIATQIEKKETEREVKLKMQEATTDSLTKVYNRRKIDDVMNDEIERGKRYRTGFAVILFDVDYFKEINDTHGHQVGDEVLIGFSDVLKKNVRSIDIVARWGGDEFFILAPETNELDAYKMAEKIRIEITENLFPLNLKVTSSIGVAEVEIDFDDHRTLLKKVDSALYEAKKRGRNNVVRYFELTNDFTKDLN